MEGWRQWTSEKREAAAEEERCGLKVLWEKRREVRREE